jgi:hypothetical protein
VRQKCRPASNSRCVDGAIQKARGGEWLGLGSPLGSAGESTSGSSIGWVPIRLQAMKPRCPDASFTSQALPALPSACTAVLVGSRASTGASGALPLRTLTQEPCT